MRLTIALLLAAVLGGCVIVPADGYYRDGGYRHHQGYYGEPRHWDHRR